MAWRFVGVPLMDKNDQFSFFQVALLKDGSCPRIDTNVGAKKRKWRNEVWLIVFHNSSLSRESSPNPLNSGSGIIIVICPNIIYTTYCKNQFLQRALVLWVFFGYLHLPPYHLLKHQKTTQPKKLKLTFPPWWKVTWFWGEHFAVRNLWSSKYLFQAPQLQREVTRGKGR